MIVAGKAVDKETWRFSFKKIPWNFTLESERLSVYELQIHFFFCFIQVLQNMNLSLKSEVQKLQALTNEQVKQLFWFSSIPSTCSVINANADLLALSKLCLSTLMVWGFRIGLISDSLEFLELLGVLILPLLHQQSLVLGYPSYWSILLGWFRFSGVECWTLHRSEHSCLWIFRPGFAYKIHKQPPKNPQSPQFPLPHHRDVFRAKQTAGPVLLLCGLFITEVEM